MTEGKAHRELGAGILGMGQDTVPEEQAVRRMGMERSLERGLAGCGCHQIPSGSEDPSAAPWGRLDHCSRRVHHVRRRRLREPEEAVHEDPNSG